MTAPRTDPAGARLPGRLAPVDRALRWAEWAGIAGASLAFAAVMAVTVADVVSRYGFHAPLTWSFDLITNYLLVAGFFLAVSAAQAHRQHINIDIFARMLPARLRCGVLVPGYAAAIVFVTIIAWSSASDFIGAWTGNLVMDGVIAWPRWPTYLLVALGTALLAIRLSIECVALVAGAWSGGSASGDTTTARNGGSK